MATAVQIQNCKTIMHEEALYQFDEIDELIELVMSKITTYMSVDELFKDPEIVAFCQSKNIPNNVDTTPGPTLEESFRDEIRRVKRAERMSKLVSLSLPRAKMMSKLVSFSLPKNPAC